MLFLITRSIHLFIKRKIIIKMGLPEKKIIATRQSADPIINKLGSNSPAFFIPIFEIIFEENIENSNSPVLMIQKRVATIVVVSILAILEKFLTEIKYE